MKQTSSLKEYRISQVYPLCVRLAALLLLYFIFRLVFFIAHAGSFPNANYAIFWYGIRYDLSAIFYSNIPYIVAVLLPFSFFYHQFYRKIFDLYFIIVNSVAAAVSYFDVAYYPYVLKRTTGDIFSYLQLGFDFQTLLPSFLKQFWYLLLLFVATCFFIIYIVKVTNGMIIKNPAVQKLSWKNVLFKCLIFFTAGFISVICMRGGFQTRPLGLVGTGRHASIQHAPLLSNTPFTLMISYGEQKYAYKNYFQDLEEAESYFSPVIRSITPCSQYCLPVKNVVVIILEGISQYLISGTGFEDEQGYCPFLHHLQQQSVSFNGMAAATRTIDALPAIFGGIPRLLNKSYVETSFANNYSYSPIEILKKHGYHTLFFHGAKNGSMNIDNYCYSIGFTQYYGKNEYPNSHFLLSSFSKF